jgi:hypothetical protein
MRQAFFLGILTFSFSQLSTASDDINLTGTYSSFKSTGSGDIVGEEVRVLEFFGTHGYWIAYQCAEGEPTEPVFIRARAKGPRILEFTVPEGHGCANTYTATFTSDSVTLKPSLFETPLRKITQ